MTDTAPLFSLVLDLEATGLDERFDDIIEMAAIGVDADYNVLFEYTSPVEITPSGMRRLKENVHVLNMHTSTGLLGELQYGQYETRHQVEHDLLDFIRTEGDGSKPLLSGSGVGHYDQRFLRHQMPELAAALHHRPNDIGAAREEFKRVNGFDLVDANTKKTHRALDDARCHLEELRAFATAYRILGDLILAQRAA